MRQRILHPKWVDTIATKGQSLKWFLWCTGRYTDQAQQDILDQLSIQRQHLAWRATAGGYVEIADPVHNIAIVYPQLSPYDSYTYAEKNMLRYAFQVRYGNGVHVCGPALYFLQCAMNKERQQEHRNPAIWQIAKEALIAKDLYVSS